MVVIGAKFMEVWVLLDSRGIDFHLLHSDCGSIAVKRRVVVETDTDAIHVHLKLGTTNCLEVKLQTMILLRHEGKELNLNSKAQTRRLN